jgi:hypothetical protein
MNALALLSSNPKQTAAMFTNVTVLNQNQEADIEEMFTAIPTLISGLNATKVTTTLMIVHSIERNKKKGWAFCHPVDAEWEAMTERELKEFREVLSENYTPFRWEAYVRGMIKYGILPWTIKLVGDRYVPVCPKIGTGYIRQYYDFENKEMVYQWMWRGRPEMVEPDPSIRFQVSRVMD